ncbi:nicotinamide N-methyltransferase-like isoform X2 [Haliotis rubra]|uniref:nicotinamide N-methyltransferase-like isoform X2 n=1 Tax=Haliotis rubra TaxID=36100 RepID=UPI001EE5B61B|nr:nicotinamide N-methyltransferase-like isoform X2 [Haliotis rubra]
MEQVKYGEDYKTDFQPEEYLQMYYSTLKGAPAEGDMLEASMLFWHEAFNQGHMTGRRLLDIGTGPTIHSVISASNYCDTVYLSDFAPQNRETLRKWLDGSLQHSFKSFFQELPNDREAMLKDKVVGIFPLDLLQAEPLMPSLFPPFDIINSSLCLEAAAQDLASYENMVRRMGRLLKDGGHVVLFGVLGESFYRVGSHSFSCLKISAEQVQDIWKRSGFTIVEWKQKATDAQCDGSVSNFEGFFLMVAQKSR